MEKPVKKQAKIKIYDLNVYYETDHRNIKYPRLEFKTGKLFLVLPKNYKKENELIEKHKKWIYEKSLMINTAKKDAGKKKIKPKEDKELKNFVNALAEKFSNEIGVGIKEIRFRKLKSKWGSCSAEKILTFNTWLKYLPNNLIKYIVLHEIAHLKQKKHNEEFWSILSGKFKNYQKNEKELLSYWFLVQDLIGK